MEHEREVRTLRVTATARFCLCSPDVSTYMCHRHRMREGVKTKRRMSAHASFPRLVSSCPQGLHSILLQDCGTPGAFPWGRGLCRPRPLWLSSSPWAPGQGWLPSPGLCCPVRTWKAASPPHRPGMMHTALRVSQTLSLFLTLSQVVPEAPYSFLRWSVPFPRLSSPGSGSFWGGWKLSGFH